MNLLKILYFQKLNFLITCTLSFSSGAFANRGKLSNLLIDVYGSQCESMGSYTVSALTNTRSLINTLQSIVDDPLCNGVQGLLDYVSVFQNHLNSYQNPEGNREIIQLEREIEEYTAALNSTDDREIQNTIASKLTLNRIQLLSAKASYRSEQSRFQYGNRLQGYYFALNTLKNYFNHLPSLNQCASKFPSQFIQILGNSIAASSFFTTPGISLGLSGISSVLTMGAESIQQLVRQRQMGRLQDPALPVALSCSAEVLTNMYCDALRAEDMIRKYALFEEKRVSMWRGIPLLFRQIEPFLDWLDLIRSGSPASDQYDAQRKQDVRNQRTELDNIALNIQGLERMADREIIDVDTGLSVYITKKIIEISDLLSTSQSILKTYTAEEIPFFLIGFKKVPLCAVGRFSTPCNNLFDFQNSFVNGSELGYQITEKDWNEAKTNYRWLLRNSTSALNREVYKIINEDPVFVLIKAYEGYAGHMSPKDLLQEICKYTNKVRQYMCMHNQDKRYDRFVLGIEDVYRELDDVIRILEHWQPKQQGSKGTDEALSKIYQILKLNTGTQYFFERMKDIVRWDVISKWQNGELDPNLEEAIYLNNHEIISDITAYKLFNLQDMLSDIMTAKQVQLSNINNFFNFLERYFYWALSGRSIYPVEEQLKSKICIHLLASDLLTKKGYLIFPSYAESFAKACKGSVLKSIYGVEKLELDFDRHFKNGKFTTPFLERACLYNNWMRKVNIHERYKMPNLRKNPEENLYIY